MDGSRQKPDPRAHLSESAQIHPTAIIEKGVQIGKGTFIWDGVHIRTNAQIGHNCIVGEKTYIAYDVRVGNYVKINSHVYICAGVTIEDFVMISAGAVFTNDKFPRAGFPDQGSLQTSEPTEDTLLTIVRKGSTIGANATIGPGIEIGEFSMIGMGSVVTKSVPSHALVYGNPSQIRGWVCVCGQPLNTSLTKPPKLNQNTAALSCKHCKRCYSI